MTVKEDQSRLSLVELRIDLLGGRLQNLEESHNVLAVTLDKISTSLVQIKYFIMGSVSMYVLSELGLVEIVKQLIG